MSTTVVAAMVHQINIAGSVMKVFKEFGTKKQTFFLANLLVTFKTALNAKPLTCVRCVLKVIYSILKQMNA